MKSLIHWPTFFITVFITTLFLILFISVRLKIGLDCDMKKISKKSIKRKCKSGDLLVVAYGSKRAKLVKVFTGSMWTHCSVIIRDRDEINVMEVARYSINESGIVISTFDAWMERNKNCIIGYRSYEGKVITKEAITKFVNNRQDVKVDMNVVHWLRSMYKTNYKTVKKRNFYCSEFITYFLQEMHIVKRKYHPAGYKPWELLYGDLPLCNNSKYLHPCLIN